jgi:HK97 family phage prohead protease
MHHLSEPIKINKSFAMASIVEKNISEDSQEKYIEVTGYASKMLDENNNWVIDADAENIDTYGIDLKRLKEGNLPLLFSHDQTKAVGKVLSASYERDGLMVTGRLYKLPGDNLTNYVYEAVKAGIINSFSVGILVHDFDIVERDNQEYLQLSKSEMIEVSLVAVPANPKATFRMTAVKGITEDQPVLVIAKSDLKKENEGICDSFACAMKRIKEQEGIAQEGQEDMKIDVKKSAEEAEVQTKDSTEAEQPEQKEETKESEVEDKETIETPTQEEEPSQPAKEEKEEPEAMASEESKESKEAETEKKEPVEETKEDSDEPEEKTLMDMIAPLKDIKVEDLDEEELENLYEVIATVQESIEKLVISEITAELLAEDN